MSTKFLLGRIVSTPRALKALNNDDILNGLRRHSQCDWGDVDEHDRNENEFSLDKQLRLFSVYHAKDGTKFWIIVRRDRRSRIAG